MTFLFLKRSTGGTPTEVYKPKNKKDYHPPLNFLQFFLILALLTVIWRLTLGYEENALTVEEIERSLTPEEQKTYQTAQGEVDEKFENCIQYILYALEDGQYVCASCPPEIPFVTLKRGEIWYIGHTCQEEDERHSQSFLKKHRVWMFTNYVGSKEDCHKVELKLIRGYKYLPESIKSEIKLILPPYNRTDKN